jgi:two-component system sensor histidine kinase KdpD
MDNGPGFNEDTLNKVLNRYHRIYSSKTGGLGLGLSIVKGFIEAHKGIVSIGNRNSGGAIVTVKIPVTIPELNN